MEFLKLVEGIWPTLACFIVLVILILFRSELRALLSAITVFLHALCGRRLSLKHKDSEFVIGEPPKQIEQSSSAIIIPEKHELQDTTTETSVAEAFQTETKPAEDNHFLLMLDAFVADDLPMAESYYTRLKQSGELGDLSPKLLDLFYWSHLFDKGRTWAFDKLLAATQDQEIAAEANRYVASAYTKARSFSLAAQHYSVAASLVPPQKRHLDVALSATAFFKAGETDTAFRMLFDELAKASEIPARVDLFSALSKLYEEQKDFEFSAIMADKALEFVPNNTEKLFKAAFNFSRAGFRALALQEYRNAVQFSPSDPASLNNLGVEYSELGMNFHAVKSYKIAFENGETLSAANLAHKYLEAGFHDEATAILEAARGHEEVHSNVNHAARTVEERYEAESELLNKTLDQALRQQLFFREFAARLIEKTDTASESAYAFRSSTGAQCTVTISAGNIVAILVRGAEKKRLNGILTNRSAKLKVERVEIPYYSVTKEEQFFHDGDGFFYFDLEMQNANLLLSLKEVEILKFTRGQ